MNLDDYIPRLKLDQEEIFLIPDREPSDYRYVTTGRIVAEDEDGLEALMGKFKLYYIDVCAAVNAKASVFELFDYERATRDYFAPIFNPGSLDFTDELSRLTDNSSWGSVLIIDRLEVLPEYRGRNVGLLAMRRLIERFCAGAPIVAIKPFPLQHEGGGGDVDEWKSRLKLADLDQNERRATTKLRRHYAKLGFKAMKGTPFMFLSTDWPMPKPEDLQK
jgi:GNAT superfamily N-acetyltransferase